MESFVQLLNDLPDDRTEAVAFALLTYDRADLGQRLHWFAGAADVAGGGSVLAKKDVVAAYGHEGPFPAGVAQATAIPAKMPCHPMCRCGSGGKD